MLVHVGVGYWRSCPLGIHSGSSRAAVVIVAQATRHAGPIANQAGHTGPAMAQQ